MIVIVGAGLAGLSAAYHLRGLPYKILEREREVGGLCRSYVKDGFTFDYTGHLLHFRQTAIKALVESLLPDRLQRHARKSFVFSHDTYTEYPFQVNTHGLPPEVVRECLLGFIATLTRTSSTPPAESPSFKQWIIESLGEGIAKHFMVPFNEKLVGSGGLVTHGVCPFVSSSRPSSRRMIPQASATRSFMAPFSGQVSRKISSMPFAYRATICLFAGGSYSTGAWPSASAAHWQRSTQCEPHSSTPPPTRLVV